MSGDYWQARRAIIAAAEADTRSLAVRALRLQVDLFALDARYRLPAFEKRDYGPPSATVSEVDLLPVTERTTQRKARGRRR